jgi:ADP-ribose pyrophosphatase
MQAWKTLERKTVLTQGRFLSVEYHKVALPDGRVIEDWPWVVVPDYANIVAETVEGRFLCFRQVKYAVEGVTLAAPGGLLEPGETPLEGAQRELLEETGYAAEEWTQLGSFPVDANRGAGTAHFFLARSARRVSAPQGGDLEEQELVLLTREEMRRELQAGQFKCLSWAAVVALALDRLERAP